MSRGKAALTYLYRFKTNTKIVIPCSAVEGIEELNSLARQATSG